jgi:hypothetical protein
MLNDGTKMFNQDEDGGDSKVAGCHAIFRGHEVYARIVYDKTLLRVYLDTNDNGWEECFIVRDVRPL